jgi:hypothetical protein
MLFRIGKNTLQYRQHMLFIWRNRATICTFLWNLSRMINTLCTDLPVETWKGSSLSFAYNWAIRNSVVSSENGAAGHRKVTSLLKETMTTSTSIDSRTRHFASRHLVNPENVVFPPLLTELGLMIKFVEAMYQNVSWFLYLKQKLLCFGETRIKEVIYAGPQIREIMRNSAFDETLVCKMDLNETECKIADCFYTAQDEIQRRRFV